MQDLQLGEEVCDGLQSSWCGSRSLRFCLFQVDVLISGVIVIRARNSERARCDLTLFCFGACLEWMGTALIFESMWEPVLVARDRWLKKDGVMLPARAQVTRRHRPRRRRRPTRTLSQLWCSPIDLSNLWSRKVGFWGDVFGIDMSPLQDRAIQVGEHARGRRRAGRRT
jgi:hypothetical protein